MPIEFIEMQTGFIVMSLILTLAVLLVVFDTIKRIKGKFNQGWRVLFLAFSLFFAVKLVKLLHKLYNFESGLLAEVLETIFIIVILICVIIINKKVREVVDYHKKK